MAEEKRKISELPSNDSPSTSTVLVGVDGGDTVKIPITEFVLSGSTDDITISTGRDINISANDAVEISANRTLGITAVDHITVESSNTMALNSSGANISFLPDGDMELFADGNIDLYSDNYVSLTSNGDMSITSEGAMSLITPGLLGLWGDQTGLYGTNCVEFLAGENDESYLYADGDCMQIMSPKTSLHNVDVIYTKNNGCGQSGQVLTTDGRTVYWGNPSGGGSGGSTPMTYITHAELKALRDDASLEDGMFYRITDYQCTTSQEGTRATDHSFDIIVQALSCNTLSEIAKAGYGGDDYFRDNNANLPAWELKYCLDNDRTRFGWACGDEQSLVCLYDAQPFHYGDTLTRCPEMDNRGSDDWFPYAWTSDAVKNNHFTFDDRDYVWTHDEELSADTEVYYCPEHWTDDTIEGSGDFQIIPKGCGVIYYMKDEHGNECPYDFKNIQFMRCISLEYGYPTLDEENGEETWVYTFCGNSYHIDNDEWSELKDGSLESPYGHESDERTTTFINNTIKPYYMVYDGENEDYNKCGKQYLNNNVFIGYWEEIGSTSPDNCPYYYGYCCSGNTLGYDCVGNTFEYNCNYNTFSERCSNNTLHPYCACNTFGNGCSYNTLSWNCSSNTFGYGCSDNTFDVGCGGNTFAPSFWGNTFGYGCSDNTLLGVWSYSNVFKEYASVNYFAKQIINTEVYGSGNFYACNIHNETLAHNDSFVTEI